MTLEPALSLELERTDDLPNSPLVDRYSQIYLKNEGEKLLLVLPTQAETNPELPWSEIWQELKHLLSAKKQSLVAGTRVSLVARDRLIDARQLQTIAETLDEARLCLETVSTNRRQTAVAAATSGYSVQQTTIEESLGESDESPSILAEPLYLQTTVRSGVEIRHPGTIMIFGDLNPGGKAIAAGDIFVWGRLRGVAHAGAQGNRQCRIAALKMEFTQLRIADAVARAPKIRPKRLVPELAFITTDGIRLAKTLDFSKTHVFSSPQGGWVDTNQPK
jgi:septum site-determining protein MinC